jgi:hypothetical protein
MKSSQNFTYATIHLITFTEYLNEIYNKVYRMIYNKRNKYHIYIIFSPLIWKPIYFNHIEQKKIKIKNIKLKVWTLNLKIWFYVFNDNFGYEYNKFYLKKKWFVNTDRAWVGIWNEIIWICFISLFRLHNPCSCWYVSLSVQIAVIYNILHYNYRFSRLLLFICKLFCDLSV